MTLRKRTYPFAQQRIFVTFHPEQEQSIALFEAQELGIAYTNQFKLYKANGAMPVQKNHLSLIDGIKI